MFLTPFTFVFPWPLVSRLPRCGHPEFIGGVAASEITEAEVRLCAAGVVSDRYAKSGRKELSGGGGTRYSLAAAHAISQIQPIWVNSSKSRNSNFRMTSLNSNLNPR